MFAKVENQAIQSVLSAGLNDRKDKQEAGDTFAAVMNSAQAVKTAAISTQAGRLQVYEVARQGAYTSGQVAAGLGVTQSQVEAWVTENNKSLGAVALPDLSNDAWIKDTEGTREALDTYVRSVVNGDGSVAEKYQILREALPDEYFDSGRLQWLNRALPGNNAQAAIELVRAVDPYMNDRLIDPGTGAGMNSLAAGAFPDAVRVGYDPSGQVADLESARDLSPGQYRDISDDLARRIIDGTAEIMDAGSVATLAETEHPAMLAAAEPAGLGKGLLDGLQTLLQGKLDDLRMLGLGKIV